MKLLLRIYIFLALVASAFLSPAVFSFIPLLILGVSIYLWLPKRDELLWPKVNLLSDFFLFFALSVLFESRIGYFSHLVSLPILGALSLSLKEASYYSPAPRHYQQRQWWPSDISLTLFTMAGLVLLISFPLKNQTLILSSAISLAYLMILLAIALRETPARLVEAEKIEFRLVAGTKGEFQTKLVFHSKAKGKVFLNSPYDWMKVKPEVLFPSPSGKSTMNISLTPPLSGPSEPRLLMQTLDQWGMVESAFELTPMRLNVIPRAKYAAWLARKYLEQTNLGNVPLFSATGTFRATTVSRTGIDYLGSRPYQAGDSLKSIDWKHSVKLNELVSKEFSEAKGQPVLILINLAATSAEESDKLAYKIITTALSLAQENIPSALATYDQESVKLITPTLTPRVLLIKALEAAEHMVKYISPLRYLSPPDITRLRVNLFRLREAASEPARALASLLEIEYKNLEEAAKESPATTALSEGLAKANKESSLLVISERNHDAEALAFNISQFKRMGYAIIEV